MPRIIFVNKYHRRDHNHPVAVIGTFEMANVTSIKKGLKNSPFKQMSFTSNYKLSIPANTVQCCPVNSVQSIPEQSVQFYKVII